MLQAEEQQRGAVVAIYPHIGKDAAGQLWRSWQRARFALRQRKLTPEEREGQKQRGEHPREVWQWLRKLFRERIWD